MLVYIPAMRTSDSLESLTREDNCDILQDSVIHCFKIIVRIILIDNRIIIM